LQRVLNFAALLTRRPGTLGLLSLIGMFVVGFAGTYVPNLWRWFIEIPVGAFVVVAISFKSQRILELTLPAERDHSGVEGGEAAAENLPLSKPLPAQPRAPGQAIALDLSLGIHAPGGITQAYQSHRPEAIDSDQGTKKRFPASPPLQLSQGDADTWVSCEPGMAT
jgi:hypothetical protein